MSTDPGCSSTASTSSSSSPTTSRTRSTRRRASRVAAHLALCDGCDRYLEQMRSTISALGHVPLDTVSDEARSALLEAFGNRPTWRAAAPATRNGRQADADSGA